MSYFQYQPLISYWNINAPNLMQRIKFADGLINSTLVYHPYVIQDGDKPETIADLYYEDVTLDWLVLITNNIIDPVSQWPLTNDQLQDYITTKYGDVETSLSTIVNYKLGPQQTIDPATYQSLSFSSQRYWVYNDNLNAYQTITNNTCITTIGYNNLLNGEQSYYQPYYAYDFENNSNEAKRFIKLVDNSYVDQINQQLKKLMSNV